MIQHIEFDIDGELQDELKNLSFDEISAYFHSNFQEEDGFLNCKISAA